MKPSLLRYSFLAEDLPVVPSTTPYERTRLANDPESNEGQVHDETLPQGLDTSGLNALATAAEIDRAGTILFEAGRGAWYDSSSGASSPEHDSADETDVAAPDNLPNYSVDRESLDVLCAAARHVEAGGEANTEVQAQDEAEIETEVETEVEMDIDAGLEVDLDTEAESEAEPELDIEVDAGLDAEVDTESDTEIEIKADEGDSDDADHFKFVVGRLTKDKDGNPIDQVALLTLHCIDENSNPRVHLLKAPANWDDKAEILKLNRSKNQYLRRVTKKAQRDLQAWQDDEREHLRSLYLANNQITVTQVMKSLNKFNKGKAWNSAVQGQDLPRKERGVASVHSEWKRENGVIENLKKELAKTKSGKKAKLTTKEAKSATKAKSTAKGKSAAKRQSTVKDGSTAELERDGEAEKEQVQEQDEEVVDTIQGQEDDGKTNDGPAQRGLTRDNRNFKKRNHDAVDEDNEEDSTEPPRKRRIATAGGSGSARPALERSKAAPPVAGPSNTTRSLLRKRKQT
ncbi:hypothetical protein W97_06896 [Coniosporium apollinis CBS 100218]|uniref:Uncharacterized protein n=1 Tax=Coniosporium apollinis (strain CBS 100218) TaxID=1168221 RepID=R7Z0B6_CONA1|nr:uncharacterized protein W97_06896 [Coniosporium apollinis CBS 100218]EON67528.1 hypothetical protein W97_06896 [Coniosporium apollinis CBS 100218]